MFHVHTYRCGHAENVPDEAYVKRAIELGGFTAVVYRPRPLSGSRGSAGNDQNEIQSAGGIYRKHRKAEGSL